MLRWASAAILLTVAVPASADWIYVDSSSDGFNISFIDKDAIQTQASGTLIAPMFSVLAAEEDGAIAYRFMVEADCAKQVSRLVTAEIFNPDHVSNGLEKMDVPWEAAEKGTQGETILNFICSRGESAKGAQSMGSALPFDSGKALLAEKHPAKGL